MMPKMPLEKNINKNCVMNNKAIENMKDSLVLFFFSEKMIIGTMKIKDIAKTGK